MGYFLESGSVVMARSKTTATAMIQPTAACPAGGKGNAKTNPCRTLRIATATAKSTVRERRSCFRVGMGGVSLIECFIQQT